MRTDPSAFSGSILVASGAIGAGMFALPIVSAGMWTTWTLLSLCLVWLINLIATCMLAQVNLSFPVGSSFNTLVQARLGNRWKAVNNLTIWFVMVILLYAYFSASASIVAHSLHWVGVQSSVNGVIASLAFGTVIAFFVWLGSHWVSRFCIVLLAGMVISFSLSTGTMLMQLNTDSLWASAPDSGQFMLAALPWFVTAFACGGLVPSLVKHYQGEVRPVLRSLIYGTLISLLIYAIWVCANFGLINRADMAEVISAGGNVGQLTSALEVRLQGINLDRLLTVFSNLAVTTSFISIGLGLFDFIADRFRWSNSSLDRLKTALLCFGPPALMSLLYPKGFILAIGYAGIAVLFSFYMVPALMYRPSIPVGGGITARISVWLVLSFAAVVLLSKVLGMLNALPRYP